MWSEQLRSPFLNMLSFSSLYEFRRKYPECLPPDVEAAYRLFLRNYRAVRDYWSSSEPQTLVHGDVHSGNVFFKGNGSVGFFDWQVVSAEHPMRDVTYFLFYAACEGTLAAHEKDLIRYYLGCLKEQVAAAGKGQGLVPTFDECWFHYRIHAYYPLLAAVMTSGLGDFITDRDAVRAFTKRVAAHFQRVGAASALDEVLAAREKAT